MDNRFRPVRAVIFVVGCLALLVFTYLLVFRVEFGGATRVTVRFASVGTIQSGSPVRQSGVKVGSVATVSLAADDPGKVDVVLSLYKGLKVRAKDTVSIVTGGLLGDQFIDVVPGDPEAPVVGPGDVLAGRSGLDLKVLVDGGGTLLQDLGTTAKTISNFLTTHQDVLDHILADAERGMNHAANAAETADRMLKKAEDSWDPATTAKSLTDTLQNVQSASKSLKTVTDALESALK